MVLILVLTTLKPLWRNIVLVPTLYLSVFVWDARLAFEPSITRLIMIGVILIVLMNARPQGLVGATRVEATAMTRRGSSTSAASRRASAGCSASRSSTCTSTRARS